MQLQKRISSTSHGFTLIEVMIAVVIVAILAAVALPSFMDQIRKSRRSDAIQVISIIQNAQERLRANQSAYATTLGTLGPATTTYYAYSVATPAGQGASSAYSVAASAISGKSQIKDTGCQCLQVEAIAGNLTYKAGATCGSLTSGSAADQCWRR